jgi:hypothetical protein
MNEQLQRAYDALQQADAAGNKEHAQQIADYIRELEAQEMVPEEKKPAPSKGDGLESPLTYGLGGALAGRLAGPAIGAGVDTAVRGMMGQKTQATKPPAQPQMPKVEPSMVAEAPARLSEPPPAIGPGAMKNVSHNVEEILGNRPAMSLTKQPVPGFEARPGRLIATPIGADLSTAAPPPTRSAAQLSAPPPAAPTAAPPKPSFMGRLTRGMAPPTKAPMYVGGAMAAGQGRDAYEQMREGNVGEAALSGAGALGGLGMFSRIKPVRAASTLLGVGTPLARMYRSLTRDEDEPERKAMGGLAGYAKGKMVKDLAVGKAPKALEDVINLFKTNKVVKPSEAFGAHEGKTAHFTQSDRLKAIEGELGGHEFSSHQLTKPEYRAARAVWGVASPQEATKIINRNKKVPEGQSIWAPLIGSPTQHQTNPHVFDPMLEEFYRQARLGKLPQETADKMMGALAKQQFGSGPRKGQLMFPNPPDIRDEDAVRALASTFENRGPLADILFAAKGAKKTKGQIIDYDNMLRSMADPSSLDAPTHSVGTRLFTLDNNVTYRPDLHSAFPHILTGADQGVSFRPIPKELALKDYIDTYRDFKGQEPGTWAFTRKPLSVDVTDKFLRRLEDAGYSKGGLAHLAGGGSPKDQDLLSAYEFERRKEGRPSNYNRGTLSRGNSRADIDIASDNGGNVYQNYYKYSDPEAAQRDYENFLAEYE